MQQQVLHGFLTLGRGIEGDAESVTESHLSDEVVEAGGSERLLQHDGVSAEILGLLRRGDDAILRHALVLPWG